MEGYNTIPVIIGSCASLIAPEERQSAEVSHQWTCYVRAQPVAIKSVQFRLHMSFPDPVVVCTRPPFEVTKCGWGEFIIQIKITLFNDDKINTTHQLVLHSSSYPCVSERCDTIVYRGPPIAISEKYNFPFPGEEDEVRRINEATEYLLDQFDRLN